MIQNTFRQIFLGIGLFGVLAGAGAAEPTAGEKLFALKLKPLFNEKCLACHGKDPKKIKSGFDMRTRSTVLSGGDEFGDTAVIPGNGEESLLYKMVARTEEDFEMPPKEAHRGTDLVGSRLDQCQCAVAG